MEALNYRVANGNLEIRDPEQAGALKWRGNFGGGTVYRAFPIPGTTDCIVIVEYPEDNIANNIMRVGPNGAVVWRASPAPEHGSYSDVMVRDGRILAQSWSSYSVTLDQDSGAITAKVFVK
jgi:hypothetical protein